MTIAEQIAEIKFNCQRLIEKGFSNGEAKGTYYGALAEQERFWDALQSNGNRKNYDYAFASQSWVNSIMKPIYDITPTSSMRMFLNSQYEGDLRNFPVALDFSKSTSTESLFGYATRLTKVGVIDISSSKTISGMFTNCSALISIDALIFKSDGSQSPGTSIFQNCSALQSIVVGGVIGDNISFQHSTKLSKASITSIVNALKADASGKTLTLSTKVKEKFTDAEWDALIATKTNWKISLV